MDISAPKIIHLLRCNHTHLGLDEGLSSLEVGFPHQLLEVLVLLAQVVMLHAVCSALWGVNGG